MYIFFTFKNYLFKAFLFKNAKTNEQLIYTNNYQFIIIICMLIKLN